LLVCHVTLRKTSSPRLPPKIGVADLLVIRPSMPTVIDALGPVFNETTMLCPLCAGTEKKS